MQLPRSLILAGGVLLALAMAACSSDTSLVGAWERVESTFTELDGMVVEIQSDESTGLVVFVPENEFRFQEGDVKWRSIEPNGEGEWSFEDLVREEGSGASSYVPGIITVSDDGNTLEMTFPTTGTIQEWVRSDEA